MEQNETLKEKIFLLDSAAAYNAVEKADKVLTVDRHGAFLATPKDSVLECIINAQNINSMFPNIRFSVKVHTSINHDGMLVATLM